MAQVQFNSAPTSLSPPTSPTISEHSTFTPHFVQALHDYLPSATNTEESVTCLYFKKGSIIEVLNRDESGWWDGQCGEMRGWFPSNYVGNIGELKRSSTDFEDEYSSHQLDAWQQKIGYHLNNTSSVSLDEYNTKTASIQTRVEEARFLLEEERRQSESGNDAMDLHELIDEMTRRVVDLVEACHSQQPNNIQLLNSRIVSSVRTVLADSNIVHKESTLLKIYPELARQRKIILTSLNQLILKSKEYQQVEQPSDKEKGQIAAMGDNLLNEMDIFEKIMYSIPRQSLSTLTDRSSLFDTPRSSISSLGYSSMTSASGNSLRQYMNGTRHSQNITKQTIVLDHESILQNIVDHQTSVEELMRNLVTTLEGYISNRHRITEMLEITRKTMESVMSFLAAVEQICSNIGDLDYSRRISMIPEDPLLVSLVISKESVYSAITNLVTAVRVLSGHQATDGDTHLIKGDCDHLCLCCEGVIKTTNECAACVQTFLILEKEEQDIDQHLLMRNVQDREFLIENHGLQTLDRKLNTLKMIQQCLDEKPEDDTMKEEEEKATVESVVESLNIASSPKDQVTHAIENRLSSSSSKESIESTHSFTSMADDATAVDTIVPETNPVKQAKMRPRAASVTNTAFPLLPPSPDKSRIQLKPSMSTTFIGTQDFIKPTPQRRSRGLSVSSLRSSLGKSKPDRVSNSHSTESLSDTSRIHRLPSWMSIHSIVDKPDNNHATIEITPPFAQTIKKEPEYPFSNQSTFKEDELILNAEGEVTGATIEALVRKLTLHEKSPDLMFTRAFFHNFRLFTNPGEFVKLLIQRFSLQPQTSLSEDELAAWTNRVLIPIRLRVYNVIKTWLETYFICEQDNYVEETLSNFAANEMGQAMPGPAQRMVELITRTFNSGQNSTGRKPMYVDTRITMQRSVSTTLQSTISSNNHLFSNLLFDDHTDTGGEKFPQPILGKSLRNTLKKNTNQQFQLHDIDPIEMARQLTLMENHLFCQIRPNELIGQEFKKKMGISQAVHVKAMIQKSTQITSFVSDSILNEADVKKRAHVLKYWIKVGDTCLHLNNYNTLMAIRSALDSTSIARLKKTWEYVSVKYKSMWEPIYRATNSQRNFAEYRQRLKTTVAPCLPFLGVYLTDLTFIDDGNSDYRTSVNGHQLINFDKYVKITRVLNEIDQFQLSYKLMEVEEIQKYLKNALETVEKDDQVFYTRSLQREPKDEDNTVDK